MVYISFAFLTKPLDQNVFDEYLDQLPRQMQEKVTQFRNWKDQTNSLLGKIMLQHCAKTYFNIPNILDQIVYNSYQRPEIDGPLSFSISHSGKMAVCAVSEKYRLGVDVEQVAEIEFDSFQDFMSEKEWGQIQVAKEPNKEFLKYWTQKEAAIKADGRGLSIPFDRLSLEKTEITIESETWHLHELGLRSSYICHLATDKPLTPNDVKTLNTN